MKRTDIEYKNYLSILNEELLPAMGCTEPIAISYAASVASDYLENTPDRVLVEASGNIIKNVKSVVVPNTDGMRGIEVAAATGIIAGDSEKKLEVISIVSDNQKKDIIKFLKETEITVRALDDGHIFDIIVTEYSGDDYAKVRLSDYHTNIVLIEKNGNVIQATSQNGTQSISYTDKSFMTVKSIYDFACSVDIEDVKPLLSKQISCNMMIAEEGLKNNYGACLGKLLLNNGNQSIANRAVAYASAGSDARMNGCEMPVVINSGSGNQGITASVPVVVYAEYLRADDEMLYRALVISNLIAILQKSKIGRLSAFCGAINAGSAAGCGIAFLQGANYEAITYTLSNALAIVSGVICDGAKASCAGKIAAGVSAGILGYEMYLNKHNFNAGDGIVKPNIEETVNGVGEIAKDGMYETDKVIIDVMLNK